MFNFILKRIGQTIVVLVLVSLISFLLMQVTPGDTAIAILGYSAPTEQIEALRKELWLDRPILVQYWHWASNALLGDLGQSVRYREAVTDLFLDRLPVTGSLALQSFILSTIIGIAIGIICATRRGSVLDQILSVFANVGMAIPIFWVGILGIYLFGLKLELLPIHGWTSPFENLGLSVRQAIMPVILMAIPPLAMLARQTRSSMLEVMSQDYVRTAWSKGLRERAVILRHTLKNALIPVVTLLGLGVQSLVGGSVLIETVFNIPGMGRLLVNASLNKDFLVVQGGVLLIGGVVCLANLLVDISYGWMDPE